MSKTNRNALTERMSLHSIKTTLGRDSAEQKHIALVKAYRPFCSWLEGPFDNDVVLGPALNKQIIELQE